MERHEVPLPSTGKHLRIKKDQTASASKYPQGYFKDKACRICNNTFTPKAPSEHYCSDKCASKGLANAWLQRNYNMSLDDYIDMYIEQDGKCSICGYTGYMTNSAKSLTMPLVIDHCHTSGDVRGLLCHTCNTALGQLKDSVETLQKAIDYLNKPHYSFSNSDEHITRKSRKYSVPDDTILSILIDYYDNDYKVHNIVDKYGITKAVAKAIIKRVPYAVKRVYNDKFLNRESVTTIPEGSTSQANGDGSGLPLTDNAEGDDIVSSV